MKEWLTIRNAVGVVLLVCFFKVGRMAVNTPGYGPQVMVGGLLPAMGAMALLMAAACFFSRSLCELFSSPFTRIIDAVFFGTDDREPPPLNLKLAGVYRAERRYEEALAEYERQLEYHPRSLELWSELVRTASEAGEPDQARHFLSRAVRRVRRSDRTVLEREFAQV